VEDFSFLKTYKAVIEGEEYYIVIHPDGSLKTFRDDGQQVENFPESIIDQNRNNIKKIKVEDVPQPIIDIIYDPSSIDDLAIQQYLGNEGDEELDAVQNRQKTYQDMGQNELNYQLNLALDSKDYKKAEEISKYMKESMSRIIKNHLNEGIQIGDVVTLDKQKGYIIGEINGNLIVQVQGSSHIVKPNEVKEREEKDKTMQVPYKFDKVTLQNLTTKALFEQFVKCGIFMGTIPVKMNDCYIKYSDWNNAPADTNVNVLVEGSLTILPKSQIKLLEDVNNFANLDNYVEGVEIDEASGEAISNVQVNVLDYTQANGDADPVRIVRFSENGESTVDTVPKATVRTLSV